VVPAEYADFDIGAWTRASWYLYHHTVLLRSTSFLSLRWLRVPEPVFSLNLPTTTSLASMYDYIVSRE
jgi:hypothetical protein